MANGASNSEFASDTACGESLLMTDADLWRGSRVNVLLDSVAKNITFEVGGIDSVAAPLEKLETDRGMASKLVAHVALIPNESRMWTTSESKTTLVVSACFLACVRDCS